MIQGVGGATALAEMLKENRTLQQLDVSRKSISVGGATAQAETLKENRTLQQLNISSTSIGTGIMVTQYTNELIITLMH